MSTRTDERPLPDVIRRAGGLELRSVDELSRLAKAIADSGYFRDADTPQKVAVKMLYAMTMGFDPVAGLQGVDLIDGTPTPNAHFWAAAIEDSPLYDYEVRERTDERCTIVFLRRRADGSWRERGEVTWTMEDARKAGLAGKDNWRKYARAMLYARAMTEGGRAFCPGLFGGVRAYAREELRPDDPLDPAVVGIEDVGDDEDPQAGDTPAAGGGADAPAASGEPAGGVDPAGGGAGIPAADGAPASSGAPDPPAPPAAGQEAWRRLFRDNGVARPTAAQRDRVKAVLTRHGLDPRDPGALDRLAGDYPLFCRVWLDARRWLGGDLGGFTSSLADGTWFETPVPSREAGVHTVRLQPTGPDGCSCQHGRTRRRGQSAECVHVERAEEFLRRHCDEDPAARRAFLVRLALDEPADDDDPQDAQAELDALRGDG